MPKRDRSQYMREYRARKRQSAEAGLDAPVAPSRAAVAESEAEPAASPEAGGGPAVPERFAATARFVTSPPMQAAIPDKAVVYVALETLAKDCGYMLRELGPPDLTRL